MKKNTHPEYQEVLFVDSSTGFKFVCGTTQKSAQHETFNGKNLPVVHLPISSSSHPLFVGGKEVIDTEGRIGRFTRRYQQAAEKMAAPAVAATAASPAKAPKTAKKKA